MRIDIHVLLFTALLSICAGVFFGIAPAGHVRLTDLRSILNESERGAVGKQTKALRNTLVVSEISLALLLLMGAGLFVRSLNRLAAVSLGFSDDHILVADLPVPPAGAELRRMHTATWISTRIRSAVAFLARSAVGCCLILSASQRTGLGDSLQHSGPSAAKRV